MNDEESTKVSPAVAAFALIVLGGILAVPVMFIFYGSGLGITGLMILGVMIFGQFIAFSIARLAFGGVGAAASRIYRIVGGPKP